MNLYPLVLERHLSRRLWGGDHLQARLQLDAVTPPGADPLGEVWQVYKDNRIDNGALAGRSLAEVAEQYGAALLGTASTERYGNTVPLLAKFIDAADALSIQVHPDDVYARRVEASSGHLGKTEAWYILDAAADAHIVWGFNQDVDADTVRRAIDEGTLEDYVNRVPVAAGDVIYNPAGTLHAVGAGIILFEIQQSSDLTYRVYDYHRRDAAGNKRELHVDKALDVLDFHAGEQAKVHPTARDEQTLELISVAAFAMELWQLDGQRLASTNAASLEILTLLSGELLLSSHADDLKLTAGMSVVLPATLGDYQLTGNARLLRCYLPYR